MRSAADPQQALSSGPPRAGFGLRPKHYREILERGIRADFAEATSENFLGRGGRAHAVLERVRKDRPIALHGVSLSIGGSDPLNRAYLDELRALAERIEALGISDHLCFGTFRGHYAHDLWPLPYTEEALLHVVSRVHEVQARLGRRILLENVSSYVEYRASALSEWEFLNEVAARAECGILLDVNNVFVSAKNLGFSADDYLNGIAPTRVEQMHLAGHSDGGGFLLDDHGSAVTSDVWQLYERALARFGPLPTIIEWDECVPALSELEAEAERARNVAMRVFLGSESPRA
ncbi:MAG TPA: DUF692 domain-containing protein [Polyangiaceae bacterium]|nr:DUF692 domain-containing protein [Polyangiaceae bacterium]